METKRDWTPILKDGVYCSPACGGGKGICDKSKYDLAVKKSKALAKKLGKGWKPYVLENLGWFWGASKGPCNVTPSGERCFTAYLNVTPQFIERNIDPRIAVKTVLADFDQYITSLQKTRRLLNLI